MRPWLFVLRRWDDLTHAFRFGGFKVPKPVHAPMTTKQMKARLQDALDPTLRAEGFTPDGELAWTRPHPPFGFAVFGVQTTTKYAPEFLGVNLYVAFRVPVIEGAIEAVCGPMVIAGERQKRSFTSQLLHRAYRDPDRPKKRLPFPQSFTLWNVDFQESVIQKIKDTIQRYALPYFDRVKTRADLKSIETHAPDHRATLFVWLGEVESALRLLDEELQKSKRYGLEMRTRLERLRESIESGELQRLLLEPATNTTP